MAHPRILRTPAARFADLPDYPFEPNYLTVDGLRMHYLDVGDPTAPAVFLLHGQPSWSYLYRHMIPLLADAGYRVVAPDLIGFGKSDKPTDPRAHTYAAHVEWMTQFVGALGIERAAAFMQDWGGLIGLRVLAKQPEWISRLVLANTAFADPNPVARRVMPLMLRLMTSTAGRASAEDFARTHSFKHWLGYFHRGEAHRISPMVQALTTRRLRADELAAYDAPFPAYEYAAGPRRMPAIVATDATAVHEAWHVLRRWPHPVLTLFSDQDPFLAGTPYAQMFRDRFPGAVGQPHQTTTDASHFLQEDKGQELAHRMLRWFVATGFEPMNQRKEAV